MLPSRGLVTLLNSRVLTFVLMVGTAGATARQVAGTSPKQVSNPVHESPVRSPTDEMATFALPSGYRVELVASEPMVQEPVVIDFDTEGRLWVVEMLGYMQDLPATTEQEPTGRISVLEDLDDDGQMDKKTVFLDQLVLPRALKVLDRGVLVGEPPNLWLARDTNGDLQADTKELVADGFGRREANVEHNANGLMWALDNWLHTSETDVFFRLRDGRFESRKTLARGQWGLSQDDVGRIYRNSNESVLHVDLVPTPYYSRNPSLLRTRGSYESLRGDFDEVNVVWPGRATPGVNRGYQTGILRADGTLARYTSVSSPLVFRGDRLPANLYGNVFVAEPAANVISRIVITDEGSRLRAARGYDRSEFLASTDERFRPVYLANAPDGTLYVVDMYRGVIQHRAYITEYLHRQILERKLAAPTRHGRIFRVVHESMRRAPRRPAPASPAQLVPLLEDANGWWRDTAQRRLVERGDRSVVAALQQMSERALEARTRLRALWTLDGLDGVTVNVVERALADPAPAVRVAAIRLAERWLREPGHNVHAAVLARADDADWSVRRQLAASLGELAEDSRDGPIARLLEQHGEDPITVDAALSGLHRREETVLGRILQETAETPARAAAITMLAGTILRRGDEPGVQALFQLIDEDRRPLWQRSALLRGAEVALLGATMPGSGSRRPASSTSQPTDPQAMGTRGGPRGAPAFPRSSTTPGAGATPQGQRSSGPRSRSVPPMRLRAEPAIVSVAAGGDPDLARRAALVIERLEWPGKASAKPDAVPLTDDEQRRFDTGRTVYETLCSACHQQNGRGLENVAPPLIGSEMAVGPPNIAVRIVLNGKEGSTGLMPPLGAVLSDDQVAAALTYIRRAWGHTASAVDAATVRQVRAMTANRTRPWTAEELAKLADDRQ